MKTGTKTGLKYFDINDIRSWEPCYDPKRHLSEDWRGTAVDILQNESIPFQDRLWVVCRTEIVSEKVMRLFAVYAYRQTLNFIKNPDPRSVEVANVAERFALGQVDEAARSAAESAARLTSLDTWAGKSAAWSTAAALATVELEARAAARSTAWSASWSAEASAAEGDFNRNLRDKFIEMLRIEGEERVNGHAGFTKVGGDI